MEERKAVWVILFTIRCASLTLSRDERFQAVWVIFFRIRSTSLTLNRMDRIVWVILFRIRYIYIYTVQVLPWTRRRGKQSGSSCSDVWWHCHGASLESPVAHTDDRWPSPHSSHLMTKRCTAICTARTDNRGKRQTVVPWKRNTAFFSLFSISLYASTEVFVCKKLAYILWQSQTALFT